MALLHSIRSALAVAFRRRRFEDGVAEEPRLPRVRARDICREQIALQSRRSTLNDHQERR